MPSTKISKSDLISAKYWTISLFDIESSQELSILSSVESLEFSDFFVPENEGDSSFFINQNSSNKAF
ncbi:hypothetical protein IKO18_00430 [bacterium]|nr:hypothetical protein [bacterium]